MKNEQKKWHPATKQKKIEMAKTKVTNPARRNDPAKRQMQGGVQVSPSIHDWFLCKYTVPRTKELLYRTLVPADCSIYSVQWFSVLPCFLCPI
jgi:hypothetical protein